MKFRTRPVVAVALAATIAVSLGACASSSAGSGASPTAAAGGVNLSGVCPSTVVMQTDWNPEADHGALYEMVGPNPTVDTDKKTVTGDLYSGGKPTGVKIQIRAGGPAIGYQTISSEMYADKSITLGYVSTDEAVQFSGKLPTTAVMAENNISPQIIMWDAKTYPKVKTIKELGVALKADNQVVRYFNGAAYMAYLQGSGILSKSVLDGSYDGTPAKYVADQGKAAQQGFATAEPYVYSHELPAWNKKVDFQLINDTGYPIYPEAMSIRSGDLTKLTPCLKKLVPVMQQADVDYFANPTATNKLIIDLVNQYNNGWVYDSAVASYAVAEMKKLHIAGNAGKSYMGSMDPTRIQKVITIDTPIFTASGSTPKAGLKPSDLFTNQFLSHSIKFPF